MLELLLCNVSMWVKKDTRVGHGLSVIHSKLFEHFLWIHI